MLGIKEPYIEPKNPFLEDSLSEFQSHASISLPTNIPSNIPSTIPSTIPPTFAPNPPSVLSIPSLQAAPPVPQEVKVTPRSSVAVQPNVPKVNTIPSMNSSTHIEEPAAQPKLTPRTLLALQ